MKFRLYGGLLWLIGLMTACLMPLDSVSVSPTPDFEGAPTINIASPLPGSVYRTGTAVIIQARIENAGPDIAGIEIKLDDTLIGEVANPNTGGVAALSVDNKWDAQGSGQRNLSITVTRSTGISATENVTIEVREPVIVDAEVTADAEMTEKAIVNLPVATSIPVQATSIPVATSLPVDNSSIQNTSEPTTLSLPSPVPLSSGAGAAQPQPTTPPQPAASPTAQMMKVRIVSEQGANVRLGPGVSFEGLGGFSFNDETELFAQNPAGTWYRIRFYNRTDGWISGTVVELLGDTSNLPTEAGPPTPIPFTPTPAVTVTPIPTNTPATQVNLTIDGVGTNPHPLVCNESSTILITVRNSGTAAASQGGTIRVEALRVADSSVIASTDTVFGTLGAGATQTVEAYITVSSYIGEEQLIRVIVDSNNQIAESNEGDNQRAEGSNYVLQPGNC